MKALLIPAVNSATNLWIKVIKVMIPISVAVKLLEHFGLVRVLGDMLSPAMEFVGLPGIMGLVWALTMVANLWSGALMYVVLSETAPLDAGQATVLGIMMLMSHGLPLEVRMTQKCGVRFFFSLGLRLFSSFTLGFIFSRFFETFSILNEAAKIDLIGNSVVQGGIMSWCIEQLKTYAIVFILLFLLITVLDFLKKNGLIHKMGRFLSPYLTMIGVTRKCASITFVGMTLGLVYGSALLLEEVKQGDFDEDDVILAVTSMNLSHSLIEDTFIVVIMGAALFWVLPVRFLWTVMIMQIIKFLIKLTNGKFMRLIKH